MTIPLFLKIIVFYSFDDNNDNVPIDELEELNINVEHKSSQSDTGKYKIKIIMKTCFKVKEMWRDKVVCF